MLQSITTAKQLINAWLHSLLPPARVCPHLFIGLSRLLVCRRRTSRKAKAGAAKQSNIGLLAMTSGTSQGGEKTRGIAGGQAEDMEAYPPPGEMQVRGMHSAAHGSGGVSSMTSAG